MLPVIFGVENEISKNPRLCFEAEQKKFEWHRHFCMVLYSIFHLKTPAAF